MAGHSAWANIKHRKARQDKLRGKAWSKCSRAIIVAARAGGGDPKFNVTLRFAIDEARAANMPKDTIEKAIKKGTGELAGMAYEQVRYEGYGPGGAAIIIDCLTDNRDRTAPEIRSIFDKHGGNLGKPGSVAFGFDQKGQIIIESSKVSEDKLMEIALAAGAEDVAEISGAWNVTCAPADYHALKEAIEAAGLTPDSAQLTFIPHMTVPCDAAIGARVLHLLDALEENDDVQKVYSNADIPEEVMARAG